MKYNKKSFPNVLTVLRMLLIPPIVALCAFEKYTAAGILFALAAATDYLDGHLARKYGAVSVFGKFLDPVADKLLVLTAFVMLTAAGSGRLAVTPPAWLVCIVAARDLLIDGLRMIASGQGTVISAGIWGKVKTVLQLLSILSMLFDLPAPVSVTLLVLMGIMTVVSGALYLWNGRGVFAADKQRQ